MAFSAVRHWRRKAGLLTMAGTARADLAPPRLPPRCRRALSRPPAHAEALDYRDDLSQVRSFVASRAESGGLAPPRFSDLVLATSELAGNTVYHTDGGGTVHAWRAREEVTCQIADTGQITDPLAWHRPPPMNCWAVTAFGWSISSVISYRPEPAGQAPPPGCTCA
jgi:hypothetical protein